MAVGFKINILPKLIEIKTNKPSISLLHVILEQISQGKSPDSNFEFLNELKDLNSIIRFVKKNLIFS